jgi:Na+-driven multidrug efflux pump
MVAQAACLGGRDAVTPAISTVISTGVNLLGDVLLVVQLSMGCLGAAAATACAEVASCAVLLNALALKRSSDIKSLFQPISYQSVTSSIKKSSDIFFALLSNTLTSLAVGYFSSSCCTMDLAAHQVLIRLRLFFAVFGDALSQTALSFVPYVTKEHLALTQLLRSLFSVALTVSGVNGLVTLVITRRYGLN